MRRCWEIKRLDDLCQIELGKTPYRGDKSFWDTEKETKNVWLSIADMLNTDGDLVSDSKEYITDKAAKVSKIVKKGTLLLSFKLTLGRLAFAGRDLFTNEAIAALTIKNEKVIDKYFLYHFLSLFDWDAASEGDVKVKGKTLNKAKLKEIEVPIPSLPEQQRIAAILDEAFAAIAKAKANTEQNLNNAKKLFESYLQGVFENKGDGWEEKTLGELSERVSVGHVGQTSEFYCNSNEGVPFIRSQNVRSGNLDWKGIQYITREFHQKLKKSQLKIGDILFVRVGANRGDCCILKENIAELNCANIVFARLKKGNVDFIDRYCQSTFGRQQLLGMSVGAAQGVINTKSVAELIIPYPPLKKQQAIVQKLDAFSVEIKKLEAIYQQKIDDLEELKKSVLQKAFAGELKTEKELAI